MTKSKPQMSKPFFLGSYFGMIALLVLATLAGVYAVHLSQSGDEPASGLILGIAALTCFGVVIYDIVVYCLLVFKMWAAIQDGYARTSPGKAVGLLFIPFYGLYWIFVVFRGFAQDYNILLDRHQLNLPRLSTGLYTAFAVLNVITAIPFLGFITLLPLLIVYPMLIAKTCDSVNSLPELSSEAPQEMSREERVAAVRQPKSSGPPAWVWILGGLAVLAIPILGIIAAIAIPSLLTAREAARVTTTQKDMRHFATAFESYLLDQNSLPAQAGPLHTAEPAASELAPFIVNMSSRDAWGRDLLVYCGEACNGQYGLSGCGATDYLIVSLGKDGRREDWVFDPDDLGAGLYRRSTHDDFNRDLVFFNGLWIRAPQ